MKLAVIFGLILLTVIGFGAYTLTLEGETPRNKEVGTSKDAFETVTLTGDETLEELQNIPNPDAGAGSGGGGGSSGGGSSGNNNEKNTCNGPQISYSLGVFESIEECTTYSGSDCVTKQVDCSVEVSNFDQDIGGTFKFLFNYYYAVGPSRIIVATSEESIELEAQQIKTLTTKTEITGSDANKNIECFANTQTVPRICT